MMRLFTALCLLLLTGCNLLNDEMDPESEPLFAPGEYGGDPLPGTEEFQNVRISPDGERVAFVRRRTPGEGFSPRNQLWVVNRDGSKPELIGLGLGTVDWSPDGKQLAVTLRQGIESFAATINLETKEAYQWTGLEHQRLSGYTTTGPVWFQDGNRLLAAVSGQAYKQPYPRGVYVIDTETGETTGPLLEMFEATTLSSHDSVIVGLKYIPEGEHDELEGNTARHEIEAGTWEWITSFTGDTLRRYNTQTPRAISANNLAVQARRVDNAWQIFLMNNNGTNTRQLTEVGGDNPSWTYGGRQIIFRRDVHKGEGARYVPFALEIETGEESPLWPALPDSFPELPPLETQDPILIP